MSVRARFALRPIGFALLPLAACGWDHIDAFGPAVADFESDDAGGGDEAGVVDGPDLPDGADAAEASLSPGTSSVACANPAPPVREWTFDTTTEAWSLLSDPRSRGSLVWSPALGNPSSGALQVDVTPATGMGAWLRFTQPLGDLTARTVSAWVWLDLGPSPRFKVFVQTGSQFAWADSGPLFLPSRMWTCVTLPIGAPLYSQASYDPTNVVILGFEMLSTLPFRVYVDSVRYD
jgi:hypothetical protein